MNRMKSILIAIALATPAVVLEQEGAGDAAKPRTSLENFARAMGVTPLEAVDVLEKQDKAGRLHQKMQADPEFASLRIVSHAPVFKVIVYVAGDAQAFLRRYTDDPSYEARTVPRSRHELLDAQRKVRSLLLKQGIKDVASDIEFETGTIVVLTPHASEARKVLQSLGKSFPPVSVREAAAGVGYIDTTAAIRGGHRIYEAPNDCTSGFSVVDAVGVRYGSLGGEQTRSVASLLHLHCPVAWPAA